MSFRSSHAAPTVRVGSTVTVGKTGNVVWTVTSLGAVLGVGELDADGNVTPETAQWFTIATEGKATRHVAVERLTYGAVGSPIVNVVAR